MHRQGKAPSLSHVVVASSLLVGALALYAPSLEGPFVFDDANITNGSLLHITSPDELGRVLFAEGVPRRVGLATFALSFYAGGLRPLGYHLVNVLLHAANAFLLYWLASTILEALRRASSDGDSSWSGLVALSAAWLWMIHPVQTQAVSYIYQRFTLLSSTFFLLSLCCWVAARKRASGARVRTTLYAASVLSGLLALGTKENAATLPLMLLALEVGILRERPFAFRRGDVVLAGLCAAAGLVTAAVYLGPSFPSMIAGDYARRGFTLSERLLTEPRVIVHYLSLLLYPHPSRLTLDYDFSVSTGLLSPPTTVAALSAILVLLGVAAARARAYPLFFLAVFWFFGNLVIESTFVPLDLAYEHRVYLPSMMIFVWLSAALLASRWRKLSAPVLLLLACGWSYWTLQRNAVWSDAVVLWEDNASKSPRKPRVLANLGAAYLEAGRTDEARDAFERAVALDPSYIEAVTSLADLHIDRTKDWREARRLLDGLLDRVPDYAPAYVSLGVMALRSGDLASAADAFERALDLDERSQAALYNLGTVHFERADYKAAAVILEEGVHYWPSSAPMQALLGASFAEMGNPGRARPALERALELDPANAMARRYLAALGP